MELQGQVERFFGAGYMEAGVGPAARVRVDIRSAPLWNDPTSSRAALSAFRCGSNRKRPHLFQPALTHVLISIDLFLILVAPAVEVEFVWC